MSGFVTIHRQALENPMLDNAARLGAWTWLIMRAAWKPTKFRIGGKVITLDRGQLCVSVRHLAKQWGWSKSSVDRFLAELEDEGMLGRDAGHGRLVLTVCKYATYQDKSEGDRDNPGTLAGHSRDTKEQINKGTIEPNGSNNPPISPLRRKDWPEVPEWMPAEQWNAYHDMRDRMRKRPTAHAVSLMIGKLQDWRAKGHDPGEILDNSTLNNWTGIFEPKANDNGKRNEHKRSDGVADALDRRIRSVESTGQANGRNAELGEGDCGLPIARIARLR